MKRIKTTNFSNIVSALAILLLVGIIAFSAVSLQTMIERDSLVRHTLIVQKTLTETLSLLTDAETGVRGFTITGNEIFLDPYNAALDPANGIQQHIQALRQLTSDNPNQQQRLSQLELLIGKKLAILGQNVGLRRNSGFEAAQTLTLTGQGKQTMDNIRTLLNEMESEEANLLTTRLDAASDSLQNVLRVLTSGASFALLLISSSLYFLNLQIRERRRAQEALQQLNRDLELRVAERTAELTASERTFRDLADSALVGIYRSTVNGEILYINDALANMMGFDSPDAMIRGGSIARYRDPQDRQTFVELLRREGQVEGYESVYLKPSGEPFTALVSAKLNGDQLIGTFLDITERKQMEEERLSRETAERASRAKSEFLSRMSHELRTPLNAILGFAQLLQMDGLTPDQMGNIDHVLKSGRHLLNLINEVLDISRIEAGRIGISPEPVQLNGVIESAVNLIHPLAEKRGISIQIKAPSSQDVFVTADPQRLMQVLLNILSNAVKYNREGGQIHVTASLQVDGTLHLAVRDTGNGIPPEKMDLLFVPFERLGTDPVIEGTGLGLALSKGLMDAMGGRIGAQSVVGEGSTFWLDLPLTAPQKDTIVMAEVDDFLKDAPNLKKGLVLYVEDNLSNIQLVEKIMARLPNVELITAMQGGLALDLARLHKPALILLDIHLPDIHGDIVLERLKNEPETKDITVVIMSADATHAQIERMLAAGARAYLTKPIDVKEFLETIGKLLAG